MHNLEKRNESEREEPMGMHCWYEKCFDQDFWLYDKITLVYCKVQALASFEGQFPFSAWVCIYMLET